MKRRVEILEIQEFDETTTEQMDQRPMITAAYWKPIQKENRACLDFY